MGRHSNLGATVLGLCGYMRVCVRVPVCSCMCVACGQLYVCVACGRGCVVICGCAVVATSCVCGWMWRYLCDCMRVSSYMCACDCICCAWWYHCRWLYNYGCGCMWRCSCGCMRVSSCVCLSSCVCVAVYGHVCVCNCKLLFMPVCGGMYVIVCV